MAHPLWEKFCETDCATCRDSGKICDLDQSMPCSPDCEGINEKGEPGVSKDCVSCDAIEEAEKEYRVWLTNTAVSVTAKNEKEAKKLGQEMIDDKIIMGYVEIEVEEE